MKYNHYVALILVPHTTSIKYVTGLDNATRTAYWKEGEPALKMSKAVAEDTAFGLNANGFHAAVLRAPDYLTLSNKGHSKEAEE